VLAAGKRVGDTSEGDVYHAASRYLEAHLALLCANDKQPLEITTDPRPN
jgi:hypothetical protein